MMRRFDAVISDIDGCLGPESAEPVDAHALAKLAEYNRLAESKGDRPMITVCSGRPQPYCECLCRVIANTKLPCICENGVWLYDPRTNRYLRDPAILPEHLQAVAEATRYIELELCPQGVVIQPGKTASISIWHSDTPTLKSLMPGLRTTFAKHDWPFRVSDTVAWINCDLAHISKATGIARMLELTGLSKPRLAGIGDMPGDLAIRQHVVRFGCPSNAHTEILAAADDISPHPEIQGVLDLLARWVG
ncbi:MAG: HAD hydrolase family protein [bacterium]|nr:HAD hydrolase family protein [bacterium]